MLFDERASTIYIFSGQRGDTYLSDLWAIKLASPSSDEVEEDDEGKPPITAEAGLWRAGAVLPAALPDSAGAATGRQPTILQITCLTRDYSTSGLGPQGGFTQRATIDQGEQGGWTVLGGLVKERKVNGQDEMGGEVWVRSRDSGVWKEVETAGGESPGGRCGAQVSARDQCSVGRS